MISDLLEVIVKRSPKRKKTINAHMQNGKIIIQIPTGLSKSEETLIIQKMQKRLEMRKNAQESKNRELLGRRFNFLNNKFFSGKLEASLSFSERQEYRNGSCTPANKTIRISHNLIDMPVWVLDYVLMHEMTHLIYSNHSKEFWRKVNEYKYTERARGFLIAKGMEKEDNIPDN